MRIPEHDCDVPKVQRGTWVCPVCGQHWHWSQRMVGRESYRGMERSRMVVGNSNLAEAWANEQVARALPWSQWREKRAARSRAKTLRRLEGQS